MDKEIPLINGISYGWADIVVTIAGVPMTGISAVSYGDEKEMKNKYGAGRHPVSRAFGRITPEAKITLSFEEVLALQKQAPNGRLYDIAPFTITVSYLPESSIIVHDKICNCQFKNNKKDWKEGDTDKDIELDLIVSHIQWHNK